MSYFEDLTPYTYQSSAVIDGTVNVGWLDIAFPYSRGKVSEEFLDKLWDFLHVRLVILRGPQSCYFCSPPEILYIAQRNGEDIKLGFGEIRVLGENGRIYAAPTLVYHYIVAHEYQPPEEFIQAVLTGPEPESDQYLNFLVSNPKLVRTLYIKNDKVSQFLKEKGLM